MSISLNKAQDRAAHIGRILLTKGISKAPTLRVGDALDISYSMKNIIESGKLQKAFNQTMGVSVKFDDNGELDVFKFDTECDYVGTASALDYENFVKHNHIVPRGGTCYAPIIHEVIKFFFEPKTSGGFLGFGKKTTPKNNMPVLMLIHTDGEPGDYADTLRALTNAQNHPIYFHFVGVGGKRNNFPTIARLADALPNVGEVYLPSFDMSDEEVYSQLICDELVEWIAKFNNENASATA